MNFALLGLLVWGTHHARPEVQTVFPRLVVAESTGKNKC